MPQLSESFSRDAGANLGAPVSSRVRRCRIHAFCCANLRSNLKELAPGTPMTKQGRRAGVTQTEPAGAREFATPGAFFLRTKLLPPRPAPEMLSRARLIERLHANLKLPVTLVAANAGSGKTTLGRG
jgi:hypothetical protein